MSKVTITLRDGLLQEIVAEVLHAIACDLVEAASANGNNVQTYEVNPTNTTASNSDAFRAAVDRLHEETEEREQRRAEIRAKVAAMKPERISENDPEKKPFAPGSRIHRMVPPSLDWSMVTTEWRNKVRCDVCGCWYDSLTGLSAHLRMKHVGEEHLSVEEMQRMAGWNRPLLRKRLPPDYPRRRMGERRQKAK